MLDPWGYSEIILHPPPLNIFTIPILPCVIKKSLMKKAADTFSKFIFWVENSLYLVAFLSYELLLCPYIYIKIFINIFRLSTFKWFWINFFFWLFAGIFMLLFAVAKDTFYFIKILCDYRDEED